MKNFLLYGSYGYSGGLIAEQAAAQGLAPILAGRDAQRLKAQAQRLGLPYRCFPLSDAGALDAALGEVEAVLHCAGPFVHTFRQMAEACLRTQRHYVDISGEIPGFEALAGLDAQAREAGVMLLPGAGFDVVPSDCLALHMKNRLPTASASAPVYPRGGCGRLARHRLLRHREHGPRRHAPTRGEDRAGSAGLQNASGWTSAAALFGPPCSTGAM